MSELTPLTPLFASCPKGLELLLVDELRTLGATEVHEARAGVYFRGTRETAYTACLWSRLASRILVPLAEFQARTPEELYEGVQGINWDQHVAPEGTLAVDFTTSASQITHSHYGALKVKDAIVDQLRDLHGVRPSVDTARPDIRVNVYLHRDQAILSLDLSGEALHRRGYRADAVEAPLKENLAAAILLRAGWPEVARNDGALVDLMCGSGTLLIEAAMMATDTAPGLDRPYFGFLHWRQHDAAVWERLIADARTRRDAGMVHTLNIRGYDADTRAVRIAENNILQAGFSHHIKVSRRTLGECEPVQGSPGLIVVNPPYGERLGDTAELPALYAELGTQLKRCFPGWRASVLTGNPELGKTMGLRAKRYHALWNGAIECRLLHFDIAEEWFVRERDPANPPPLSDGAKIFENRLRKDWKHFGKWARRQEIYAYRVYDADLHDYNFAIDVYESDKRYVHVQEYEAPATVDQRLAERRLREALTVIPQVLEIPPAQMFVKQRRRQRGGTQYEQLGDSGEFHEVREGACRLLVNLSDYLDTGLFLDHRTTRTLIGELAKGKAFLNLFGYTGSATVHAALGGATSTVTVDMSNTYLEWAERNFALNDMRSPQHELVRADITKEIKEGRTGRYGLIFLDPPTFSRSKRMEDTLDIQRDHVQLIRDAASLLEPKGILIFSTNLRRFKLERDALAEFDIEDITRRTLPADFERDPKIHQCFRIQLR